MTSNLLMVEDMALDNSTPCDITLNRRSTEDGNKILAEDSQQSRYDDAFDDDAIPKKRYLVQPDSAYSYLVLLAAFFTNMLVSGLLLSKYAFNSIIPEITMCL